MKTRKLKTTVFALATILLTACGGDNNDPVPTPVPNQRVKSSSVKYTDYGGEVSIKDYTLTYNAENRLTKYQYLAGRPATVTDEAITYNPNNKVSESMGRNFEYDADGKVVKITSSSRRNRSVETTLTYDDTGKIITVTGKRFRSGVEDEENRIYTRLTYTNEKLTKVTRTRRGASSPSTTDLTYGTDGNISRMVSTSSNGRGVRTTNFTYDTHNEMGYNIANNSGWLVNNQGISLIPLINSYNGAKVFNQLGQIDMGYVEIILYAKNNVLTKQEVTEYDNVVNRTISHTYNYTYNSAKYPLTVNESLTLEETGTPAATVTWETKYAYENY